MPKFTKLLIVLCTAAAIVSLPAHSSPKGQTMPPASKASPNASVSILEPRDGAIVSSPFKVVFGVKNMTLIPAGTAHPESGHHHLLINLDKLPDMSMPIPADAKHLHFGKAQKETQLELPEGKHSLQLLLGDHFHRPHDKPVLSEKITITVKATDKIAVD